MCLETTLIRYKGSDYTDVWHYSWSMLERITVLLTQ